MFDPSREERQVHSTKRHAHTGYKHGITDDDKDKNMYVAPHCSGSSLPARGTQYLDNMKVRWYVYKVRSQS